MTTMIDFPDALEAAGVNVRVLDGWNTPHISNNKPYIWREDDGDPAGHMHHHTATSSYVPNRDKANGYAGLSMNGSDRLYQEDYGDGDFQPIYTIANAYPAPISSGAGDITVLERVRAGIEVVGRQGSDTPDWYGNTHYWNTEYALDGIGAPLDQRVWDMMVTVCQVQNELMGWTQYMHIGHGHHTRRKIDLYAGQYADFNETIIQLREDMDMPTRMSTERWATRLRNPEDFDRMASKNVITEAERDYWVTVPTDSPEMNDLRDAVDVRNPLWNR